MIGLQILCLGDSNTYGYDPRGFFGGRYAAEDRWVDLLAKQTGHTLINAGVNGREIPSASHALSLISAHEPADALLVMLGTNDLLQGTPAAQAADRMETLLRSLLPCCRKILLAAPPPLTRGAWVPTAALVTESLQLTEEYRQLAGKLQIPFADTRNWNIELTFDGVHFTEAGHHTFARRIAEYL